MNYDQITMDQVTDVKSAAAELGCTQQNARLMLSQGKLKYVRFGRTVLILRSSIMEWKQAHPPIPAGMINLTDAAKRADVTRQTIVMWIQKGRLNAVRHPHGNGHVWIVNEEELSGVKRIRSKKKETQEVEQLELPLSI